MTSLLFRKIGILSCVSFLFCAAFIFKDALSLIILVVLSGIVCILEIKNIHKNYLTVSVIFCCFSIIYAISGPLAIYSGEGLPAIFIYTEHSEKFLSLCLIAHCGIIFATIFFKDKQLKTLIQPNTQSLFLTAIALALIATTFELINLYRAGGISSILQGKASYQSALSDMFLTLPSGIAANLSIIYLALSNNIKNKKNLTLWLFFIFPYLISLVIIGRRGPILGLVLTALFTISLLKPINKIPKKYFVLAIIAYISLAMLNSIRAVLPHALEVNDLSIVKERLQDSSAWLKSLNPASSEFGAAFGNFSAYYSDNATEPLLGKTYIEGLTISIPRFIWPNKPESILYQFRDEYFYTEASRGSIASTAYSSILEAYTNFREIGVFLVYFIFSLIFLAFERSLSSSRKITPVVTYLLLAPLAMSFHRSSLGEPLISNILIAIISVGIYTAINSFVKSYSYKPSLLRDKYISFDS